MSWPGSIPQSTYGDTIPLSPINFSCLIVVFDELRQILYDMDSQSFRSSISSIFGRPRSLSAKAQPLEDMLYLANSQLRKCYIGCQAHLEDVSANELKMKVLEHPKLASALCKAKLTLQRSEERIADIRTGLQAHGVFHKQPSEAEYTHYIKTIHEIVARLVDMVKVLNRLYLETLNAVSGFDYMELPNFELRKIDLPAEDEEYLEQVERHVGGWLDVLIRVAQDDVVMVK